MKLLQSKDNKIILQFSDQEIQDGILKAAWDYIRRLTKKNPQVGSDRKSLEIGPLYEWRRKELQKSLDKFTRKYERQEAS